MKSIELILYLEPDTSFNSKVNTFLHQCQEKFGTSTANKYACHVTMTGFFNVDNEQQQNAILKLIDETIKTMQLFSLPIIRLKSFLVRKDEKPVHLLLPVCVPDDYHTMMTSLANQCRPIVSNIRLKGINHVSLAYWDEPRATKEQQQQWEYAVLHNKIYEQIEEFANAYFATIAPPDTWDIVFYKRAVKGELVGQPHVFEELGRWKLK